MFIIQPIKKLNPIIQLYPMDIFYQIPFECFLNANTHLKEGYVLPLR